ncbi:MAG: capsular biosynthesis protein [Gammaproteobacteria bacterium]
MRRHFGFLRLFSSAVTMQALLSAANFATGLIFIRLTSDVEYGSFVLVNNALVLLSALQGAFILPFTVMRVMRADKDERAQLIGGMRSQQLRALVPISVAGVIVTGLLWAFHVIDDHAGLLVMAAVLACAATLYREFYRVVLLSFKRPNDVLRSDAVYVVLLVAGALIATLFARPAVVAVACLFGTALVGQLLLSRSLWKFEPWSTSNHPPMWRDVARLGAWSGMGAAVHWSFSQGYNYLVAGTLDVTAVAALSATRLFMMPVSLLSSGIGTIMFPTASSWLHAHGAATVMRRVTLFALGLVAAALCYLFVMWVLRDWIFVHILRKSMPQRDLLLTLWSVVVLLIVLRDQLGWLLAARGRFRMLTMMTVISAVLSLTVSYFSMLKVGVPGALIGVITGELVNVLGVIVLSIRELRIARIDAAAALAASQPS